MLSSTLPVAAWLACLLASGVGSVQAAESGAEPDPDTSASKPGLASAEPASPTLPEGTTAAASAATAAKGADGGEGPVIANILSWNVHWTNKDLKGIAGVIQESSPDIVGLNEFTASLGGMAGALSEATGRDFALQPGRGVWQGYGTDIFFDQGKWKAVEGGVQKITCPGTRGGDRAANWVVLQDRVHGKLVVAGGTHLTYCAGGCDATHECELGVLYDNLERVRSKYPGAAVVWMGDMNRGPSSTIMRNLRQGKIGSRVTFSVDDLAQVQGNTYYQAGTLPVDYILGEAGQFERISGGLTGQGVPGQHLSGADHFPVRASLHFGPHDRRLAEPQGQHGEPQRATSLRQPRGK